jgi:6-phospho-3-hexuloisomerase
MVEALAGVALRDGARVLYLTAQPGEPPADRAHRVVTVNAQTMADDLAGDHSGGSASAAVLPMGSAYEIALFVLVDLITDRVRARRGESAEEMRSRHTNLE